MAKKKQKEKKRKLVFEVLIFIGLMLVATVVGVVMWQMSGEKESELVKWGLPNRGLPVMEINLNGVSLEEIEAGSKEMKYPGNELFLYDDGARVEYQNVELKGRGNTTWLQEKKPFQIKFDRNVDLLGLGKAKKWVLLAGVVDPTYLRNEVAFTLAEMIGSQYNHRGEFVELYIDNSYRGLYYMVQKIDIAKGSVDLRRNDGVLMEMDMLHRGADEKCYETYFDECLVLKDIIMIDDGSENVIEGFLRDFNKIEKAVEEGDYETMAEEADIESFAVYYLINEFTVNPDAYSTSFYVYRNNEGKISAGPVWDFDYALANRGWVWQIDERMFDPNEEMVKKREAFGDDDIEEDKNISRLVYYMTEMPEFRDEVEQVFQERMKGEKDELRRMIVSKVNEIYRAAKADGEKWERYNFEKEVLKMMRWIDKRYEHFERTYGSNEVIEGAI